MLDFSNVNWLAAAVAAATSFALGGVWYAKAVFGRAWSHAAGRGGQMQPGHPPQVFGVAFVLAFIAAVAFALLVGPSPGLRRGLEMGLAVGVGFVATSFGINYLFSQRTQKLWLIDAGYHVVQFLLYGLVFGLWK
jgi:hypothetical protein